jgi:hypothetical protein
VKREFPLSVQNRGRARNHRVETIRLFFHPNNPLAFRGFWRKVHRLANPFFFESNNKLSHSSCFCPIVDPQIQLLNFVFSLLLLSILQAAQALLLSCVLPVLHVCLTSASIRCRLASSISSAKHSPRRDCSLISWVVLAVLRPNISAIRFVVRPSKLNGYFFGFECLNDFRFF